MKPKRIQKTKYGYSIRPRLLSETHRVLVGKRGMKIVSRLGKLEHAFRINPDGTVKFLHGIKASKIDEGVHGTIHLIEQASLRKIGLRPGNDRFVLKVFKQPQKTDGITQYVASFTIFNYLKQAGLKHVFLKSPPIYAAGHNFLVAKAIYKPTLSSVMSYFTRLRNPREQAAVNAFAKRGSKETEYFPIEKVPEFVKEWKLTERTVEWAWGELQDTIKAGNRVLFRSDILFKPDLKMKNFMIHGVKEGKIVFSFFDQGMFSIPNVWKKLRKQP
jgi:endonuclease V-like protein UPF0215 family